MGTDMRFLYVMVEKYSCDLLEYFVSQEMTALSLFMMGSNRKDLSAYFEDALSVYRANTK